MPDALGLTLAVRRLPDGVDGGYDRPQRRITIAKDVLSEDPRIVAVILAHELRHAVALEWVAQGAVACDCLDIEARSLEIEAIMARAFWPDALPGCTDRERDLVSIVEGYERSGIADIRARLVREGAYLEQCTVWQV